MFTVEKLGKTEVKYGKGIKITQSQAQMLASVEHFWSVSFKAFL